MERVGQIVERALGGRCGHLGAAPLQLLFQRLGVEGALRPAIQERGGGAQARFLQLPQARLQNVEATLNRGVLDGIRLGAALAIGALAGILRGDDSVAVSREALDVEQGLERIDIVS